MATSDEEERLPFNRCKEDEPIVEPKQNFVERIFGNPRCLKAALCYFAVFMVFGMSDEIIGPTLLELSCVTGKSLTAMSWMFFVHDLSNVIGSSSGGILVDRFDPNFLMAVCLSLSVICLITMPVLHVFGGMLFMCALYGGCFGASDTFTTVQLVRMFGKQVSPFLQTLHFFYGLGAFLSPLLARPFLRNKCVYVYNGTVFELEPGHFGKNISEGLMDQIRHQKSDVRLAYWIIALMHIPVIFGLLWLLFSKKLETMQGSLRRDDSILFSNPELDSAGLNHHVVAFNPYGTLNWVLGVNRRSRVILITALCSLIILLYDGLMAAMGGYIYTYAVRGPTHFPPKKAAYLNSVYWGSLSVGRFISIPIAVFLPPPTMLVVSLSGSLISSFFMMLFHNSANVLWVGTSAVGLFMSSVFPTTIALAEYYIDLTGLSTSVMIVSAALGELLIPLLVGQVFERLGPVSFLVTVFIACLAAFMVFTFIQAVEGKIQQMLDSVTDYLTCTWYRFTGEDPEEETTIYEQGERCDNDTYVMPEAPPSVLADRVELRQDTGGLSK